MSEKRVRLHIEGMSCGHCQKSVTEAINQLGGIRKATVTLDPAIAEVDFDDAVVSVPAIIAAIDGTEVYSASLA